MGRMQQRFLRRLIDVLAQGRFDSAGINAAGDEDFVHELVEFARSAAEGTTARFAGGM